VSNDYTEANRTMTRYHLGGFKIDSELPLPELWHKPEANPPADIAFRVSTVAECLTSPNWKNSYLQLRNGIALLTVPRIARYRICHGQEIIIDPAPGSMASDVRLFLLGTAFGILCHQRGLFPLHASTIVVNGCAVAFVGESGAGKSTLGAWLAQQGYPLLGDDVCILKPQQQGAPLAQLGSPRIKLWSDALNAMNIDPNGLQRDMSRADKYHLDMGRTGLVNSAPLRSIYQLVDDDSLEPHIEGPDSRLEAIATIADNTYRRELLPPLGLTAQHFLYCAALAQRVPVFRLCRRRGLGAMDTVVTALETHWHSTSMTKADIHC
jgi:hypothetical protein